MNFQKIPTITAAMLTAAAMFASTSLMAPVFAAPTLHGGISCAVNEKNQLECTLNVSGLAGATTATATMSGTATVVTGCINRGATDTQPQGLQRTTTTVSQTQTVNVESGRAFLDILTTPLNASELGTCPDQMTPVIVCVTFADVSIAVVPNSGPSRTFPVEGTFSNC